MCCFDKTGTLTDDSLILQGVLVSDGEQVSDTISNVSSIPSDVVRVMASCHSLIVLEGNLAGDPLEKAAFQVLQSKMELSHLLLLCAAIESSSDNFCFVGYQVVFEWKHCRWPKETHSDQHST